MKPLLLTVTMLVGSNLFMTYAWYGHLRDLAGRPWFLVALAAWGVAFFEYQLQVPANRIGYGVMTLPQLKILQEAIALLVFIPFSILYMKTPISRDFAWAALCLMGAVYFIFRGSGGVSAS